MYVNEVANLTRRVFRDSNNLNILCVPTHERYETSLAKTGHNFYAMRYPGVKDWKPEYSPIPSNYTIYSLSKGEDQIPHHHEFDLVLSQNKFGQFQVLAQIARQLNIPLVSLEHTAFMPYWDKYKKAELQQMRANANVFITDWSLQSWDWEDKQDTYVITHCVDTNLFSPLIVLPKKNYILTVGNDYIGRDYVLNFSQYKRVVLDNRLPARPVGDTPGLSKASANLEELVSEYQAARIFFNTHHISPMPTSLLEAMSCECACVSIDSCAISQYIKHGENGFLYKTDQEALEYLQLLLRDEKLATKLGQAARQTIIEKCDLNRFVSEWNNVFHKVTT